MWIEEEIEILLSIIRLKKNQQDIRFQTEKNSFISRPQSRNQEKGVSRGRGKYLGILGNIMSAVSAVRINLPTFLTSPVSLLGMT